MSPSTRVAFALALASLFGWVALRLRTLYLLEREYGESRLLHAQDVVRMCTGGNERPEFGLLDCASARRAVRMGTSEVAYVEAAASRLASDVWDVVLWATTDLAVAIGWRGLAALVALPAATMLGRRAALSLSSVLVPLDAYLDDVPPAPALAHAPAPYAGAWGGVGGAAPRARAGVLSWDRHQTWEHVKSE